MKQYLAKYLVLALIIMGLSFAVAQANGPTSEPVGTAFTYQGRLTNGGKPVNGRCDFIFSLWDAPSGGNRVGTPLGKAQVSVWDGLFTVTLDFANTVDWNAARWLQIQVRCPAGSGDYVLLSPRQRLTPTPFALALPGLRTLQNDASPDILGGYAGNYVTSVFVEGATISGGGVSGQVNYITDDFGVIGGGRANRAGNASGTHDDAEGATVGGGIGNFASNRNATIAGGSSNKANGVQSTIGGGYGNKTDGLSSIVAGGAFNEASGDYASIGGGRGNIASGPGATIGGGGWTTSGSGGNQAEGAASTIAGGFRNRASGSRSTIGGGEQNTASGYLATIAGGFNNEAGFRAAVGGGDNNKATGSRSVIPGGGSNEASGDYSFAAGRRAKANKTGCFMWADATNLDFSCIRDNAAMFRSTGGFYIYTYYGDDGARSGAYLAPAGHAWNQLSDRNAKEHFRPVDKEALLERLARMEISTWNYKDQGPDIRHIGPMAQDFNALLPGLGGEGETYINSLDADGVALAAIQGLYQRSQRQAERIAQLEEENAMLKAQLADLAARLAALEAIVGDQEK